MLHYSHLSGDSNGDAEGFSGISISLFTLLQLPVAVHQPPQNGDIYIDLNKQVRKKSPDASFNQSGAQEFPGAQEFRATVEDDGLDADYSMVGDYPEEPDYYVLLGLSRNPPPNRSRDPIRLPQPDPQLPSAGSPGRCHPDKQPPHLRYAGESQFRHIQEAYETLIDPNKRVVYDISGAAGVRQEWGQLGAMGVDGEAQRQEVGVKAMSPDQ
ncbi:hypothetical protein N7489_004960 [Penicillium chrysogenum]|uniref:uncharacterized protein n=1 Tax=Penicillium chrysogenum TaxID=5076 RepID=UPI0024DF2E84|nr:uncharacterized protein N7489_004960 [Penicillium chrysogenum]KAJ5244864.1 hypothetical protein N7489_004960 [Penicillium chrysogenum]